MIRIKKNYAEPEADQFEIGTKLPIAASPLEAEGTLETFSEETYVW